MSQLTANLPLRHPATLITIAVLLLGYCMIAYTGHLETLGHLPKANAIKTIGAILGLHFWAWLMLKMIGDSDEFLDARGSLTNAEITQRRIRRIVALGYISQAITILGFVAYFVLWARAT